MTQDEARTAFIAAHDARGKAIRHFLKVHAGIRSRTLRYRDDDYDAAIERLAGAHLARTAAHRRWEAITTGTPQRFPKPKRVK